MKKASLRGTEKEASADLEEVGTPHPPLPCPWALSVIWEQQITLHTPYCVLLLIHHQFFCKNCQILFLQRLAMDRKEGQSIELIANKCPLAGGLYESKQVARFHLSMLQICHSQ